MEIEAVCSAVELVGILTRLDWCTEQQFYFRLKTSANLLNTEPFYRRQN
jgi:hypothetical protein